MRLGVELDRDDQHILMNELGGRIGRRIGNMLRTREELKRLAELAVGVVFEIGRDFLLGRNPHEGKSEREVK
jgi:hypothetical protein